MTFLICGLLGGFVAGLLVFGNNPTRFQRIFDGVKSLFKSDKK